MVRIIGNINFSRCYNPLLYNGKIYAWYGPFAEVNGAFHNTNDLYEIDPITGNATKIVSKSEGTTDDHYTVRNVLVSLDSDDIFYGYKARWETLKLYKANRQDGSVSVIDINTVDGDLNYPKVISRDPKYLYIYARGCNVNGYGRCWRLYRVKIDCIEDPSCYEKITTFVDDTQNSDVVNHTYASCFKFDKLYCSAINRGTNRAILFILDWDGTVRDLKGNIIANPGEGVPTNDSNLVINMNSAVGLPPIIFKVDKFILAGIGISDQSSKGKIVVSDGNDIKVNDSVFYGDPVIFGFDNGVLVACGKIDSNGTEKCIPIIINNDLSLSFNTDNAIDAQGIIDGIDLSDNSLVTKDKKLYNAKHTIFTLDNGIGILDLIPSIASFSATGGSGEIDFEIDFDEYNDSEVKVCIEGTSNCKTYTALKKINDKFTGISAGTYRLLATIFGKPIASSSSSAS